MLGLQIISHELRVRVKPLDFCSGAEQKEIFEKLAFDCFIRKGFIAPEILALQQLAATAPLGFKFNPYHDDLGRFTFAPGGGADDSGDDDSADSGGGDEALDTIPQGGNHFFPGVDIAGPREVEAVGDSSASSRNPYSTPSGINYGNKIQNDMQNRGWTPQQIDSAVQYGNRIEAINKATGAPATRYINPDTGASVIIDNTNNTVIQVGRPDFIHSLKSGDAPGAVMKPPSYEPSSGGGGGPLDILHPKKPWENIEE